MKISIIIPVYNAEQYIEECINSVFMQDIEEKEIICVDDGSTDCSCEIIRNLSEKYSEIHLVTQNNQGPSMARNQGLKIAIGQYVVFLDADDYYIDKSALRSMVNICENEHLNACGGIMLYDKSGDKGILEFSKKLLCNDSIKICTYESIQCSYGFQGYIFNREFLINNNLSFPNVRTYEDPIFLTQALLAAEQFAVLQIPFYCYRLLGKPRKYNSFMINELAHALYLHTKLAVDAQLEHLLSDIIARINKEYYEPLASAIADRNMTVLLYLLKIEEYIKVHGELEQQENIHLLQHVKNTLGYFKEQECFEYEFPYEHVKLHEKVIVYGAGAVGQKIVSQIKCTDYVDMERFSIKLVMSLFFLNELIISSADD